MCAISSAEPQGPKQASRNRARSARDRLLEAGALLFVGEKRPDPLGNLTVSAVSAGAGVVRSTFYRYWETRELYLADLVRWLLGDPNLFEAGMAAVQAEASQALGPTPLDDLARIADSDLATLKDNEVWIAMEVLAVAHLWSHPEHHLVARDGYQAVDQVTYDMYRPLLDRLGRTPRSPLTEADVGKLLQALVEGAGIRQIFEPDAFTAPIDGSSHSAYAYGVAAVLAICTEPRGVQQTTVAAELDGLLSARTHRSQVGR